MPARASAPVLRTEHLQKTYAVGFFRKKVRAVVDVSIAVEPGEIFGLLGPNGAGKTTTLKLVLGLVRPSSGTAQILGAPIGDLGAKRKLGYLPESPYFYDYLTGRELLIFMAKLFGIDRKEAARRADELLERVDMTRAKDLALRRYSKGMLQRIGIAQALINRPELVILDEPLSGLDPIGRKDVRTLIASLRAEGRTVIFSSHILSDVELLADRVAIVVHGKSVRSGPLSELLSARVSSTEVVLEGGDAELGVAVTAAGHRVATVGQRLVVTIDGDQSASPLLELGRAHGAEIRMVSPRTESLEDLVLEQVRSQGEAQGRDANTADSSQRA